MEETNYYNLFANFIIVHVPLHRTDKDFNEMVSDILKSAEKNTKRCRYTRVLEGREKLEYALISLVTIIWFRLPNTYNFNFKSLLSYTHLLSTHQLYNLVSLALSKLK